MSIRNRRIPVELLLLLILITIFHWRGIRPGFTFLPVDLANNNLPWLAGQPQPLQNILVSDPLYQFYPFLTTAVRSIQQSHQWSLWNPDIFTGHPSLGDPLSQPFFPILLGAGVLFGAAKGFALGLWLQVMLAGGFTYAWLRSLKVTRSAAVAGGLVYALSGYLVTWFATPFWVGTLCFLPAVLWATECAVQQKSPRFTALAGAFFGLSVLSGQLQFIISMTMFLSLYALGRTIDLRRQNVDASWWPLASALTTIVMGALLGAVFLLPAFELLGVSRRLDPVPLSDALPLSRLITLIVPNFYGSPVAEVGINWWTSGNYGEGTIYASIVALLLACLAPFVDKRFFTRYISLLTVGIVYFIVGGPGVQLLKFIPGIRYASLHRTSFIIPLLVAFLMAMTLSHLNKLVAWWGLGLAVLFLTIAGLFTWFNWEKVQAYRDNLMQELFITTGLLLMTVALVWLFVQFKEYQPLLLWSIVLLVFIDTYWFGHLFNPVGQIEQLMPATPSIHFLQSQKVSHLASVAPQRMVALQQNDQVLFGPNVPTLFGLAEAGGYSSLVNERYHQLISAGDPELDVWWMSRLGNMVTFSNPSERLLDLLQVSHVASSTALNLQVPQAEFINDGCVGQSDYLSEERPLSGQFSVEKTAINRADFRFIAQENNKSATDATVNIRIWQGINQDRLIFENQETLDNFSAQEDKTYFFAPEVSAPGNIYAWEITTDASETNLALCLTETREPAISIYGNLWTEVYADEIMIYEKSAPMPRAYVVYAAEYVSDDSQTVNRLLDDTFSIDHAAITAQETTLPRTNAQPLTPVDITEYQNTKISIHVKTEQDGLLIFGDQYYPGWQATIDGISAPILRVNHIFRGILLPSGEHNVIFIYRPLSLYVGMGVSLVGLLLIAALLIMNRRIKTIIDRQ